MLKVLCLGERLPRVGDLKIETLYFKTTQGKLANYQTGTFYVKENRSDPESRVIGIGFSRFKSINSKSPAVFFYQEDQAVAF